MLHVVQIISGIALILFGVRLLREGVGRMLGPRMDDLIDHLAHHPGRAFFTGLGIGAAVPSSTSVSMLVTQAFRTSRLVARQGLPLMLGADIGITALVLLTSLHLNVAIPFLIIAGVVFYQFTTGPLPRGAGQVLLGLAFVLTAVTNIELAGSTVAHQPDLVNLIQIAEHYPLALMILSGAMAIALQSSTATILLVASFGSTGSLSLPLTLYVVLGANLGIATTRLAIGWNLIEARRLAVAALLNRCLIAWFVVFFASPIIQLLAKSPFHYALNVALTHFGYNVLAAISGTLLASPLLKIAALIVIAPPMSATESAFGPRYINGGLIDTPALALGQSLREIVRAAEIVREMLNDLWRAMETSNEVLARAVSQRDDQVDLLDKEVKQFLTQIAELELDSKSANEQMRQLRFLSEVEAIGDIVDKNLSEIVLKKMHGKIRLSEEDWQDLQSFFLKVRENMLIAETAFQTRDRELATQLRRHKEFLNRYHRELADRHLARMTTCPAGPHDTSAVHLDLLANLKRINSCISHVAYAVLSEVPMAVTLSPSLSTPATPPASSV